MIGLGGNAVVLIVIGWGTFFGLKSLRVFLRRSRSVYKDEIQILCFLIILCWGWWPREGEILVIFIVFLVNIFDEGHPGHGGGRVHTHLISQLVLRGKMILFCIYCFSGCYRCLNRAVNSEYRMYICVFTVWWVCGRVQANRERCKFAGNPFHFFARPFAWYTLTFLPGAFFLLLGKKKSLESSWPPHRAILNEAQGTVSSRVAPKKNFLI